MQRHGVEFNAFGCSKASRSWSRVEKLLLMCIFMIQTSILEINTSELCWSLS